MFLFPCLDWCIDISAFEKVDFLARGVILKCSRPLDRLILNSSDTYAGRQKIFKKCGMKKTFEIFIEKLLIFPEIYFGHAGTT